MIPKLIFRALSAAATNPEIRRRVLAAVKDPELRQQVVKAAAKGAGSLRTWWAARDARQNPSEAEQPVPPITAKKQTLTKESSKTARAPRKKST